MIQLRKATLDHGSLVEIDGGTLSPLFWDSLPMAASLEAAFAGWPREEGLGESIDKTKEILKDKGVSFNAACFQPHKVAVQAIAYRNLFDFLHPDDNSSVLSRRLHSILGSARAEGWLEAVVPSLRKLKCFEVVQVLRTWSNSWSTSYRYHESRLLPCLLGCPGEADNMIHYARCPLIQEYVSAAFGHSLFQECLESLGTTALEPDALRQVTCIYYAYHVVKFHPGICTTHIRERTTHHRPDLCEITPFPVTHPRVNQKHRNHPDLEGGATQITASAIVVDVALARSSFIGGLKAAASSAGLNCPIQRSLPSAVAS